MKEVKEKMQEEEYGVVAKRGTIFDRAIDWLNPGLATMAGAERS